jgi:hypothetical protein
VSVHTKPKWVTSVVDLGAISGKASGIIAVTSHRLSTSLRNHAGCHEAEMMGSWGSNAGKCRASGILLAVSTAKPSLLAAGSFGGCLGPKVVP